MPVSVVTDSASYLPADIRERLNIREVSLYVRENGSSVRETELDTAEFYSRLATSEGLPTTSQPSPEDFAQAFEEAAADGSQVLAVLISSGMSSTVDTAKMAAGLARERVEGLSVTVVDTRANCMQEGFAVIAAAEAAAEGRPLEECERAARESMRRSRFLFTPRSLEYLRRGGRISRAGALLGSTLGITPILTAEDGTTGVAGRVRTQSRALDEIARLMRADVDRCGLKQAVVQGIVDLDRAAEFARSHIEPIVGGEVPVIPIGPVIGLHVGPAVAVTYETVEPLG